MFVFDRLRFVPAALALLLPATTLLAAPAPQRPPITGIAHVAIATQDMAASRHFYTHYLGWTAVASPEFADGVRFYGDPRQTVEVHPAKSPSELALEHVAFATTNAEALRMYLKSKGVAVPDAVNRLRDGEQRFLVKDPEGNAIEFVQRPAGGLHGAKPVDSISGRIIHAGFIVKSAPAEDQFYRNILGFKLYWTGGMKDNKTDFFSLQVPDGTDWLEYMLNNPPNPSHHAIGVADHFSLGVVAMDPVVAAFQKRGFPPEGQQAKQMGRDGKYQLNEFDPDGVRIEYMEFKPAQKPCCHDFTAPHPEPDK
ncbi:VOC family protein [Acidipila sp. EB88]|uniref:VOC family protein n=1 Tax=Acidipila sp. EB88 TaxID=2305226 RepID=UPI000F5E3654|nr:VOC family protein [Acidipila sp. EB88]RRA48120.1 glyoxalase [Acidipila sp. EB88]